MSARTRRTPRQAEPDPASRIAKALAHPLRARILERLAEVVASPNQLAGELDASLGVVSYHVRVLADSDCLELVRTQPRRGAVEHFYRATVRARIDDKQWRGLPTSLRRDLVGHTLRELWADVGDAADAGGLDDPGVHVSRLTLELDARGWDKLGKLLARTLDSATAIQAESIARAEKGAETRAAELGLLQFERRR